MYVKVENGIITQTELPITGYLKSGESVSGYNLLPKEVLLSEGWRECTEDKPTYDEQTEYLIIDYFEVNNDEVIAHYKAIPIESA